jgi:hypothetical protein
MEQRIFCWNLDGFGSKLYRITRDGKEQFVSRHSPVDNSGNDHEAVNGGEAEYGSFQEFWQEFTDQPSWLRYRPVFIHKECKPYLQNFFQHLNQGSMTITDKFRVILWLHKIE